MHSRLIRDALIASPRLSDIWIQNHPKANLNESRDNNFCAITKCDGRRFAIVIFAISCRNGQQKIIMFCKENITILFIMTRLYGPRQKDSLSLLRIFEILE